MRTLQEAEVYLGNSYTTSPGRVKVNLLMVLVLLGGVNMVFLWRKVQVFIDCGD